MQVHEAIAEELVRRRVSAVFVLMGEDTMKLIVELTRRGVLIYGSRNEHAAVGMADGYARASGEVGVAILSRGPGLTQATNALVTAAKARSSIVVLAGDSPARMRGEAGSADGAQDRKYIDQGSFLDSLRIANVTATTGDTATADVAAAFERARGGLTVTVNIPPEVMRAAAGSLPSGLARGTPLGRAAPSHDDIGLVADLLEETWAARRPLVLAGAGAVRSAAGADLKTLSDSIGAILGTTLLARSLFAGHPYDVGVVGTLSTPLASELIADADLVLAFGASLNQFTTYRGGLLKKARVIQFDSDARALGLHHRADITVLGDAALAAAALGDELERRGHRGSGYRTAELAARINSFRIEDTIRDTSRPGALDPRSLMVALDKILPTERTVVGDSGNHFALGTAYLTVPDPRSFMFTGSYGAVGTGQGIALGAAAARRERLTVLVIGDRALMMRLGDLDTCARYNLPILVVVLNDSAFGAEVHMLRAEGLPDESARFNSPSFESVARAMGVDALTISTLDDLTGVPEKLARMS